MDPLLWTSGHRIVIFRRHFFPTDSEDSLRSLGSTRFALASVLAALLLAAAPAMAQTTPASATSTTPVPAAFKLTDLPKPPIDSRDKFVGFMQQTRKEDAQMLLLRYNRAQAMIENKDVWRQKELIAYLLTPREEFVLERNRGRAYESACLDIGYGVTISGPHLVGRMT